VATHLASCSELADEEGFRPTNPTVWQRVKDFGGWNAVNKTFFDNGGLWDRLFAQSR
jgi:ABC-type sulfate transport system substrate-binding protein